jgi:hypothetical protein
VASLTRCGISPNPGPFDSEDEVDDGSEIMDVDDDFDVFSERVSAEWLSVQEDSTLERVADSICDTAHRILLAVRQRAASNEIILLTSKCDLSDLLVDIESLIREVERRQSRARCRRVHRLEEIIHYIRSRQEDVGAWREEVGRLFLAQGSATERLWCRTPLSCFCARAEAPEHVSTAGDNAAVFSVNPALLAESSVQVSGVTGQLGVLSVADDGALVARRGLRGGRRGHAKSK